MRQERLPPVEISSGDNARFSFPPGRPASGDTNRNAASRSTKAPFNDAMAVVPIVNSFTRPRGGRGLPHSRSLGQGGESCWRQCEGLTRCLRSYNCNRSVQRAVFDKIAAPKALHEIEGGHFGLLWSPGPLFDEAAALQTKFISPHTVSPNAIWGTAPS